jgi:DNA-binding transcriptional MerR regulator
MVGVEPQVLRRWESDFPELNPKKSSTGQRMFRRRDVLLLLRIKYLLYERKYTVEAARRALSANEDPEAGEKAPRRRHELFPRGPQRPSSLPHIRQELTEILKILS